MSEDKNTILEIVDMFFALRGLYERLHGRSPDYTSPEFGQRIVLWEESIDETLD